MPEQKKNKTLLYNIAFLVFCASLLLFLWKAPEETTARLPNDPDHEKFQRMDKKEAEKLCGECHSENGPVPLSAKHPPKYRCLFCHKQNA
ncbi:MAG: hypothetical protein A2521_14300 [Deltaproteobacteria bacterium RIFOXYD12_FULL_57_12]|nr:MAG: hypothetical protein A2521_14300 [Deltaproteobacteria bacterium RIFOXYD12_FULL_57_12]